MNTFQAILDVEADGSVHVPLPVELRQGKVMVIAMLVKANESRMAGHAIDYLRKISARGGLKSISDPSRWQQESRRGRTLPGRNE